KRAERAARQEITDPPHQRAIHLVLEILAKLARGALGALKRDIAGKALGHHDIHGSLADIVTLDKADIFEFRPPPRAQHLTGLTPAFRPFPLLNPDIEAPHRRLVETE